MCTHVARVVRDAELVAADLVDADLRLVLVPERTRSEARSELPDAGDDVFVAAFRDAALVVEDGEYAAKRERAGGGRAEREKRS